MASTSGPDPHPLSHFLEATPEHKRNAEPSRPQHVGRVSENVLNTFPIICPPYFYLLHALHIGDPVPSPPNGHDCNSPSTLTVYNNLKSSNRPTNDAQIFVEESTSVKTPTIKCTWVATDFTHLPSRKATSLKDDDDDDISWRWIKSTGGYSYAHTGAGSRRCWSNDYSDTTTAEASYSIDINFICTDLNGHKVSPPGNCKATARFSGEASQKVHCHSGYLMTCLFWTPQATCQSQGEASLSVINPTSTASTVKVFNQALKVENGNKITRTESWSLGFKGAVNEKGPSAEISGSFGGSRVSQDNFGDLEQSFRAYGAQPVTAFPAHAVLTTFSSAQINLQSRVHAAAEAYTSYTGMWFYAQLTDCGEDIVTIEGPRKIYNWYLLALDQNYLNDKSRAVKAELCAAIGVYC